jgi:hypothetical protein
MFKIVFLLLFFKPHPSTCQVARASLVSQVLSRSNNSAVAAGNLPLQLMAISQSALFKDLSRAL